MTDVLLITTLTPDGARAAARHRGIRAAFIGTVKGKAALLAGMESYDKILEWWKEGCRNAVEPRISDLRCTAHSDAQLDRQPLVAVAPTATSPLAGVTLNRRVAK